MSTKAHSGQPILARGWGSLGYEGAGGLQQLGVIVLKP
ncbi:predicted protein [Histoplasma mississippiense (nom. inval.)]|nr:predicted protein [Histoplasma mississippiense (nom. inval.)]EDN06206.1 predicted protein [Histoplasma mississippiense (nom. inval.)]